MDFIKSLLRFLLANCLVILCIASLMLAIKSLEQIFLWVGNFANSEMPIRALQLFLISTTVLTTLFLVAFPEKFFGKKKEE